MKILILNQDWFAEEWRQAGHDVIVAGVLPGLEFHVPTPLLHIDTVIDQLPRPFSPDLIVCHDNSSPILFSGLNETSVPTFFYSVDIHHHMQLHVHLYQLFDKMAVAQRDYIPDLERFGCMVEWLPLWSPRLMEPCFKKEYEAIFVGNMNAKLNPERVRFLNTLQERVALHCQMGEYWNLFPKAEIVLNQTVKGDLNFRVFEGLASGSLLLTERSGNGLFELFRDGEHLVAYTKNDIDEVAERIGYYLGNRGRAREIGAAGREEILRRHTSTHRAVEMMELVAKTAKRPSCARHFSEMVNMAAVANKLERIDTVLARRAVLLALKAGASAVRHGDQINEEIAFAAVQVAAKYDLWFGSNAGAQFVGDLEVAYPGYQIFLLFRIRRLLNEGQLEEARAAAASLIEVDERQVFNAAEQAVAALLAS